METIGTFIGELERTGIASLILRSCLLAARIAPVVALAPFLGGRPVPSPVKVAVIAALVALAFPASPEPPAGYFSIAWTFSSELCVGAAMGFAVSLSFTAVTMAGRLVDDACGTGFATVLVPQLEDRESPLSAFYFYLYAVVFFLLGGHLALVSELIRSYTVVPAGQASIIDMNAAAALLIKLTASSIRMCLWIAAPSVAAGLISEACVGVLAKSLPQMNAFLIGMPLRVLAAILLCLLGISACLSIMSAEAGRLSSTLNLLLSPR